MQFLVYEQECVLLTCQGPFLGDYSSMILGMLEVYWEVEVRKLALYIYTNCYSFFFFYLFPPFSMKDVGIYVKWESTECKNVISSLNSDKEPASSASNSSSSRDSHSRDYSRPKSEVMFLIKDLNYISFSFVFTILGGLNYLVPSTILKIGRCFFI